MKIKKIIVLGSGALKIGEAGEFDYSGSQALKAFREEGIKVILVNPNIATVQTSKTITDSVYLCPVTPYFVEKIIEKEKPNAIAISFGGQTALNCGIALHKAGILEKHKVKVLGTPIEAVIKTEDRELFKKELEKINVPIPKSISAESKKEALKALKEIKFPVIIRSAYALGGLGSGIAFKRKEFEKIVTRALAVSPQILIEEYLDGWKEIEYEVVRDKFDNCITVCNMENFDPMGIHTGESIVVAPSQTLTNYEYHKLRETAIKIIKHLGIIGECNIQFALNPKSEEFKVIEVNARLSRSSALASKATGYPLAFIAAKLALGKSLIELRNSITKKTSAFFEPALDYIVVKIPRWDLTKFRNASKKIGSEMKSVGEVMAIGRTFEEAIQKAIRMLDINAEGITGHKFEFKNLKKELREPTDKRIFAIEKAMQKNFSIEEIHKLTKIDKWFLFKLKKIIEFEKKLMTRELKTISFDLMLEAKKLGFSDKRIAEILKCTENDVRNKRISLKIKPFVKQIDTLAAEYPAKTNYLYLTYNAIEDDIKSTNAKTVIVLGSGAYRIGSSVEFDWCAVNAVQSLKKLGFSVSMINFNPETVSTDYDICERLYFEELSLERVQDIYEKEKPLGIIVSVGGQTPNNIALDCAKNNLKILGTNAKSIDLAEDRHKFSKLCDSLSIDQPEWKEFSNVKEAIKFAESVEFPVIVRPSYVLSGQAMNVAFNARDLKKFLTKAIKVNKKHPVIITKFIENAKEIEVDAVACNGKIICQAISEHIENAGVHSGDATIVLPPQKLYLETIRKIKIISELLAEKLEINGPFNLQFIAKNNEVKVIECNLRASRSFPFVSKISGINFIDLAMQAIMKKPIKKKINSTLDLNFVGVKAPQFSFSRIKGADPILSVEMTSTGEVACIGKSLEDAFLKAIISTGVKLPEKNVLVSISGEKNRLELLEELNVLKEKFKLYATKNTHEFLKKHSIESELVFKATEKKKPNVLDLITEKKIDLIISIPFQITLKQARDDYLLRRTAVDFCIPLVTNLQLAKLLIKAITTMKIEDLEVKPWHEYIKMI